MTAIRSEERSDVPRSDLGTSVSRFGLRRPDATTLMWASLVPLLAVMRPYAGLIQDARIYIGRGMADRDPAGLGRDLLFSDDAQTGFSALSGVVRALLAVLSADRVSMLLVCLGLLLWLGGVIALVLRVARGRAAWAMAVAILVLPADYGAFATDYAEAIATPRVFAEAAVLAALASILDRRRLLSMAFLMAALALHPLMALPGIAVVLVLLISEDRRWLLALLPGVAAVLVAAALKLPVAERLFLPMDATWFAILRERSPYLFPTLWSGEIAGRIASRLVAVVIAGRLSSGRISAAFRGVAGVALGGVLASLVFADLYPSVLITQLQPWRALWLLAVAGNAGLALSVVGLWREGPGGRLAMAVLILAWCSESAPVLAIPLSLAALGLQFLGRRGDLARLSPMVAWAGIAASLGLAACDVVAEGNGLLALLRSMGAGVGDAPWPYVVTSGVLGAPAVAAAVAVTLVPSRLLRRHSIRLAGGATLAVLCLTGVAVWDSRTREHRMIDHRDAASDLARVLGRGEGPILWIDDDGETWFLARRPAFFNVVQGAPILFSRNLALAWAERGRAMLELGLIRAKDVAPWSRGAAVPAQEIILTPEALTRFCADPGRPAALVAPGAQLAAVPPPLSGRLWRPPSPVRRLSIDEAGFHWRAIETYTVVRCARAET